LVSPKKWSVLKKLKGTNNAKQLVLNERRMQPATPPIKCVTCVFVQFIMYINNLFAKFFPFQLYARYHASICRIVVGDEWQSELLLVTDDSSWSKGEKPYKERHRIYNSVLSVMV